jgi:hypothetical protein
MNVFLSQCQIVQLGNPFASWHDPIVRSLFEKTATLKFEGYRPKFPRGVVPVDASDWVADHFLVCLHHRAGLEPIMGFRRVTLARCREHYLPFSPLMMCHESGCGEHIREMKKLVRQFDEEPEQLSYTGSFTILPDLRADWMLKQELLHLMVVLHYLFHEEETAGHEIITAAAPRFKLDVMLQAYGFIPLLEPKSENNWGTIPASHAAGEPVRCLRARGFSLQLRQLAEGYRALWTNRTILGQEQSRSKVTARTELGYEVLPAAV